MKRNSWLVKGEVGAWQGPSGNPKDKPQGLELGPPRALSYTCHKTAAHKQAKAWLVKGYMNFSSS